MNPLRRKSPKRACMEFVALEDYRPTRLARLLAWSARRAWALSNPGLAAEIRRRQQWWKDVEQFRGPVFGLNGDFMGLELTWARAHSDWITFGFQRDAMRPTTGLFVTTWRKGPVLHQLTSERPNFAVRATVFEATVALAERNIGDQLLTATGGDALDVIRLKALRMISVAIPGFARRALLSEAAGLGVFVIDVENETNQLVLASRGLETHQLETLTRSLTIVQESPGLLDVYRRTFRARQRALGYVVEY